MDQLRTSDVAAALRRSRWILTAALVALALLATILVVRLDKRLDSFENAMRYRAPNERTGAVANDELAEVTANPVQGQIVYVPAYSHVYHQDGRPHLLTITLSVRNTSRDSGIVVKTIRYFDTEGREVQSYLSQPLQLAPLATTEVLVAREDKSGGSGASFLVEWVSAQPVTEPVVEAVMIDTSGQQGISFVRRGTVVDELQPPE